MVCWDARQGGILSAYPRECQTHQRIGFDVDPSGRFLATGSGVDEALLYDLSTGECMHEISFGTCVNGVAFHPHGLPLVAFSTGTRHTSLGTSRGSSGSSSSSSEEEEEGEGGNGGRPRGGEISSDGGAGSNQGSCAKRPRVEPSPSSPFGLRVLTLPCLNAAPLEPPQGANGASRDGGNPSDGLNTEHSLQNRGHDETLDDNQETKLGPDGSLNSDRPDSESGSSAVNHEAGPHAAEMSSTLKTLDAVEEGGTTEPLLPDLSLMKVAELREALAARGARTEGLKNVLVARLESLHCEVLSGPTGTGTYPPNGPDPGRQIELPGGEVVDVGISSDGTVRLGPAGGAEAMEFTAAQWAVLNAALPALSKGK